MARVAAVRVDEHQPVSAAHPHDGSAADVAGTRPQDVVPSGSGDHGLQTTP